MAFNAKGASGIIKVGGREGARLGSWELKTIGGLTWMCEAQVASADEYWMTMPVPKELHLFVGTKVYRFRNVRVGAVGDSVTVSGTGVFDLQERG